MPNGVGLPAKVSAVSFATCVEVGKQFRRLGTKGVQTKLEYVGSEVGGQQENLVPCLKIVLKWSLWFREIFQTLLIIGKLSNAAPASI